MCLQNGRFKFCHIKVQGFHGRTGRTPIGSWCDMLTKAAVTNSFRDPPFTSHRQFWGELSLVFNPRISIENGCIKIERFRYIKIRVNVVTSIFFSNRSCVSFYPTVVFPFFMLQKISSSNHCGSKSFCYIKVLETLKRHLY